MAGWRAVAKGRTEEATLWIQGWLWSGEGKLKRLLVTKGFHFARGTGRLYREQPGKLCMHAVY